MGFSITNAAEELYYDTIEQQTEEPLTPEDYKNMIVKGVKRLFVDTGRALEYDNTAYYTAEEEDEENDIQAGDVCYDYTFPIDEIEYIMIWGHIEFYKRVQAGVNKTMGYSTDALTVTGADKPYAHLKDTIAEYEKRRREVFYHMPRYVHGYGVSD